MDLIIRVAQNFVNPFSPTCIELPYISAQRVKNRIRKM